MKKNVFLPAILWALLILILCGLPGKDIPHISFLELLSFDKLVHAGIFFVLTVFGIKGCRLQKRSAYMKEHAAFLSAGISSAYGGLMEILQGTIFIGRTADIFDFIADSIGCVAAVWLYPYISRKIPRLNLPL
ncbi:MAG TPA: VanZ family protein [Bacteroidia bacterium]|nr:VanZ family protein [Bacteroidia bacterium]